MMTTRADGRMKSAGEERSNHATLASHLLVAVPDACIQQMIQMALKLRGYQVTCTPIDLFHPLGWIAEAVREQPETLIVDVDLFRYRSVQETILDILHAWKDESCLQPPDCVWLSRRPIEGSAALRMPFRLAQLDAVLRGRGHQDAGLSPDQHNKKWNEHVVSL